MMFRSYCNTSKHFKGLCNHSNGNLLAWEKNMLFSRVDHEIPCLRAKAHLVFHWCLYDNNQSET